ncbi:MAG: hypothetical protein AAF415_14920 [Pseudomonadota bacterium]
MRIWPIWGFVIAACLAACEPIPIADGPHTARLRVSGGAVFVNDQPARDGQAIVQGDRVSTGSGSSAGIEWSDGTIVQLDENSDPIFKWSDKVLGVNVGFGWFLFDTGEMSIRVENEFAEVAAGSRLIIELVPGMRMDAYLLRGRMQALRPPGELLPELNAMRISANGRIQYRPLPLEEARVLENRFRRWEFAQAIQPEDRVGPKIDLNIGIGGIFGGGRRNRDRIDRRGDRNNQRGF